jgi:hypothetical protein
LGQLECHLVDLAGELELTSVLVDRVDGSNCVAAQFEWLQTVTEEGALDLGFAGKLTGKGRE